jgi:hypothetical protein
MHSRSYFVARVALTLAVGIGVLAISAWIASFICFSISTSGQLFLLGYGAHGWQIFFTLFPWLLFSIDVVLILFLEWLLQGFKFGYRVPLLSLVAYVLVGSIVLGLMLNALPLQPFLLDRADHGELPLAGDLYEGIRYSHHDQGVFRGTITTVQGATSTLMHNDGDEDVDDGEHTVITGPLTQLDTPLQVGDVVYVFGTEKNGVIEATGIHHL